MEENPLAPSQTVKKVRVYKKIPHLTIPVIPSLPLSSTSYVPATLLSGASTQVPLRAPKRTKWDKLDDVLQTYGFDNLGDFLATLFHHHVHGETDNRTPRHRVAVTAFLQGTSTFKMAHLIELLYNHPQSRPKRKHIDQRAAAFSPYQSLENIRYAKPCLSAWATRLVGDEAWRRMGRLVEKTNDPDSRTHLRATTNGRKPGAKVATWKDMTFTIHRLADKLSKKDLIWYLTECMSAPRVKGKVVVRKRRPHPVIQVGAISSFMVSRNSHASGDLALPLGIWHFACKSHVDVKRVYCRFGSTVSDTTSRNALNSMGAADLNELQMSVRDATSRVEAEWGKILDNVQQYSPVYEHGLGRENQLKVGTACTAFRYVNCKPGAWKADEHIARVIKQERQTMTTENVFESIDWPHNRSVAELHFVRVLADFIPQLNHISPQISALFRTEPIAKHQLPPDLTPLQPLATNAEREVENSGMLRALLNFDQQLGVEPEKSDNILSWVRGDGASHATVMRLKQYLAVTPDIYKSLRNVISTPETWHTKSTELNSAASNHYGSAASKDPSSLSRSSNAANMKRPTDLKKCDFYPTSRSMTLIWEAQVLDCWRLILDCDSDLLTHFDELASNNCMPTLQDLIDHAGILRERYASQAAYDRALSTEDYNDVPLHAKVRAGSTWTQACAPEEPEAPPDHDTIEEDINQHDTGTDHDMPGLNDIPDDSEPQDHDGGHLKNAEKVIDIADDASPTEDDVLDDAPSEPSPEIPVDPEAKAEEGPKIHREAPGFDGDRVLANTILFLIEFGWWIELNYSIPEGDVGRLMEIFKIYIFTFAGSSNQNYMRYMLDLYALLQFECSPDLRDAILNNFLFNLKVELGKFIEGDLMQEHFNRWLEDMVRRRGGDFDDKFFRQTISPNAHHFLRLKEDVESAFELKRRGKAHTSPSLRDETKLLLRLYKEEELHLFRSGRSMGHAAINRFDRGYQRLDDGKMAEFLDRSAVYADIVRDMEQIRQGSAGPQAIAVDRASPVDLDTSDRRSHSVSDSSNDSNTSSRPPSSFGSSGRSSCSAAARAAANSVEEWDFVDHSDEYLVSGSDLAVTVDAETGRMNSDWYEEEEFEAVLDRLCGAEEEEEDSEVEDEVWETESDDEDGSDSDSGV